MIGESIAHYPVTEKIGAGGMGEVYRVPVETQPTFRAGRPEKIYEGEMVRPAAWASNWDVSPDGRKFVFVRVSED